MAQDISKNLWALVLSAWIASRAAIIFFGKDPREVSQRFASENAFYYSFYSQLLSESPWKLWEDRLSEAPSAILALRRFNIYQELCFGLLFQGLQGIFGESISPASFYCLCVFIVYGLGLWAFFGSLETSAEVIFCGALYLSSFQACTHVAFMPPLRENCALPFWFCSMKVLQEMYRNEDKVRWSQRVLFLTSVTSFLLLWQFACFALLLQVLTIYALLLLDIVSASFVSMVSRLYVSSVILSFGLRFGDLWSLRSPFFSMALVFCFVHRLGSWRLRVLLPVAVIVLHYLWPSSNEDDSHITAFLIFRIKAVLHDILGVGVAPEASYHVALYAGQRSFSPPSLAELRQLVLLAGAIAFLRIPCLPREQRFLNALRGLLALAVAPLYLLMMRYQMLFFPHMALLGASLVTVLPKSLRLATAVGLLAISDPFISGQPDPGPTQETEDQVERGLLMAWMRSNADSQKKEAEKPDISQRRQPSLLKELGMKVTAKGVLLPESRKTLLRRRRETRQAALGDSEAAGALAIPVIPSKRRRGSRDGPVLLDEIESDLFYGAHQGSVSACAGAVAQGADVNVRNKADLDGIGIGATALHVAAVRGHEDVAAALLHAKADCMALTGRGESPVQLATRMGHVEVVKVLRTAGAAPKHEEGVVQLMSQAPSAWRDGQRKKLRKAITGDGANGARPKEALPPPPPPPGVWEGPDERMAKGPEESPKVKGKGKGKAKGKRRRKGKEGKPDY